MFTEKHDKEKAEKERQRQIEKENAERLAREVKDNTQLNQHALLLGQNVSIYQNTLLE